MRLWRWWTGRPAGGGNVTPTRAALAIVALLASVGAAVAPAAAGVVGGDRVASAAALTVAELGVFAVAAAFLLAGLRPSARPGLVPGSTEGCGRVAAPLSVVPCYLATVITERSSRRPPARSCPSRRSSSIH